MNFLHETQKENAKKYNLKKSFKVSYFYFVVFVSTFIIIYEIISMKKSAETSFKKVRINNDDLTLYLFRFCQNDGKDMTGKDENDTQLKLKYTVLCANISAITY